MKRGVGYLYLTPLFIWSYPMSTTIDRQVNAILNRADDAWMGIAGPALPEYTFARVHAGNRFVQSTAWNRIWDFINETEDSRG